MSEKKKWSEIVKEERDKGNVVFLCVDEVMIAPVKEIIKQPADGLLWDLNRDAVTALTFMDEEGMVHWVNNFAVALVIRELKAQLTQLEAENETLHKCNAEDHELMHAMATENEALKKDAAPFQAQIDQRKTYRVTGEDDDQTRSCFPKEADEAAANDVK